MSGDEVWEGGCNSSGEGWIVSCNSGVTPTFR